LASKEIETVSAAATFFFMTSLGNTGETTSGGVSTGLQEARATRPDIRTSADLQIFSFITLNFPDYYKADPNIRIPLS
jgi:hypothetical protein